MRSVKQIEVKGARPRRGLQTVAVAWKQGKDWIGAASGEDTAQEPAQGHRATVGGDKLMVQRHSGRWSRAGNSGPHWERTRPETKIKRQLQKQTQPPKSRRHLPPRQQLDTEHRGSQRLSNLLEVTQQKCCRDLSTSLRVPFATLIETTGCGGPRTPC